MCRKKIIMYVYVEHEPSEKKKRVVVIMDDLKAGSQSYIPLKEFVFYWVEGLCLGVWLGGGRDLGWDVSQLSE